MYFAPLSLFVCFLFFGLSAQEYTWNSFSPDEFSEPVMLLKENRASSFELVFNGDENIHRYRFLNDSSFVETPQNTAYVLRNGRVFPVLSVKDSLEFRQFWKGKSTKKYDSSGVIITSYYEPDETSGQPKLTFKTCTYPDSLVSHSYDTFFKYVHTEIRFTSGDSIVSLNRWADDTGVTRSIASYRRTTNINGNSTTIVIDRRERHEETDRPEELREYRIVIRNNGQQRPAEIEYRTNVDQLKNYRISNIRY